MIKINEKLKPADLGKKIEKLWELSAAKIHSIEKNYDTAKGSPVFTVKGKYTTRGWTEWTQGFQYGAAILQFDATGETGFLEIGRDRTLRFMAPHLTHMGVHDHGFNNVSTYGNLLRLLGEGRIEGSEWEKHFYELALKCSGAAQARRWTSIHDGTGYIYSFNGPQSLFADTMRSLRSLALGHRLGHVLMEEGDEKINLLRRLVEHAFNNGRYNVYYREGRDSYDLRGRTVHESIFNLNDGNYRCPSSQQGFSPFTTWTRGLAWVMCGYPEELEFLDTLDDAAFEEIGDRKEIEAMMLKAAEAACDFYIAHTPVDGVPYWDTGAPNLHKLGDCLNKPADPFNDHEPVDASAAAIAAQGLLRLGHWLQSKGKKKKGQRYWQAGLTVLDTIFDEPYLSFDKKHQGLLLHSVYHRPNGWDYIPPKRKVPCGESSMWGDYHVREAALYVQRIIRQEPYHTFFHTIGT